ncbi:MAG: HPr(Ser) kinase/phosphatase [Chromatiales bacterium]|nr:HPr(Ser) kinase/phosphatase [Chromatiales bacterium]
MQEQATVQDFFDNAQQRFALQWIAGLGSGDRAIVPENAEQNALPLAGLLNCIHPNRIQVIGTHEWDYLQGLKKNSHEDAMDELFEQYPAAIIVADGMAVTTELKDLAEAHSVALMRSDQNARKLVAGLQIHLYRLFEPSLTLHGVLLDVMGIGVLLVGDSGVGKSELALELITRGHRLVADDAPQLTRVAPDLLEGVCPNVLWEYLEVRGLGVLNVRALFGDTAVKASKYLRLIINLVIPGPDHPLANFDRLEGDRGTRNIMGVEITQITIPVLPGRNLAVLVEVAVRDHILRSKGYNAATSFIQRQRRAIAGKSP